MAHPPVCTLAPCATTRVAPFVAQALPALMIRSRLAASSSAFSSSAFALAAPPCTSHDVTPRSYHSGLTSRVTGTALVSFENVHVPIENLVGKEDQGFMYVMYNFNHERHAHSLRWLGCGAGASNGSVTGIARSALLFPGGWYVPGCVGLSGWSSRSASSGARRGRFQSASAAWQCRVPPRHATHRHAI